MDQLNMLKLSRDIEYDISNVCFISSCNAFRIHAMRTLHSRDTQIDTVPDSKNTQVRPYRLFLRERCGVAKNCYTYITNCAHIGPNTIYANTTLRLGS